MSEKRTHCQYCNDPYREAKARIHCRRVTCRSKMINSQIKLLENLIGMTCNIKMDVGVELRLAGNDKISSEVKIEAWSFLEGDIAEKKINGGSVNTAASNASRILAYFRTLLWKEVRGNFIITINEDGSVGTKILNQTFTSLKNPVIVGNNMIIHSDVNK